MAINSLLNAGVQGFQQNLQGAEKAAAEIVRAGTNGQSEGSGDFLEPMMELKLYERAVQASVQVVRTADEVLGSILDEQA